MPSVCPGPGWAAKWPRSTQCTHTPQDGCAGTLAAPTPCSWLAALARAHGAMCCCPGAAPAARAWLCSCCARLGAPRWAAVTGSQWDLGVLVPLCWGSNSSWPTMLALPSSCWSKRTGGAGVEWTKVSAGVPHHTMPPLLTPHCPQEAAERGLTSCAACLILQGPCKTVLCSEPDVSAGLQTTRVTDYCVTTHLLCLPPASPDISVVTVASSSCHHLSPSVTHTTLRLGH